MERKLAGEGLSPKEAKQAIALARVKQEVGMSYPRIDGVDRERSYELLTEEDRKLQNRLTATVRKVFDKKRSKYVKVDEMKQQLLEESLTPEEVEQAISLAEANQVMRWCLPHVGEIHGEPSYELLTEEDIKIEEEEEKELEEAEKDYQEKKRTHKKTRKGRREQANTPTQREKK